ncbi:hypothetical protein ACFVW2_11215 [Streptomyces sp. NPDC058171]
MITDPLIAPLASSPFWHLLRLRLVPQPHTALVFLAEDGDDRVEPPRGHPWAWTPYPRPALSRVRRGRFRSVQRVSLAEHACTVDVATGHPLRPPQCHRVAWRISDPVAAVRWGLTGEGARQAIARDVGTPSVAPDPLRQPSPPPGTHAAPPPGQPRTIEAAGIVYWLLDPAPGHPTGAADPGPDLPPVFGEVHREAYRFYREVVAGGPADLAAFWLLQHPDQAREVLAWTVEHRDLLTDRDGWEHTLATTLRGLDRTDRGFVGANVAQMLSDIGVPQGDEVLRRMERDGVPSDGTRADGTRANGTGAHRRSA